MGALTNNNDAYMAKVQQELRAWPGVTVELARVGSHRKLTFHKGEQQRFMMLPTSGSDWRGPRNAVTDMRKTLRELGAEPVLKVNGHRPPGPAHNKSGAVAKLGINRLQMVLTIPQSSPIFPRFCTSDGICLNYWRIEARSNPEPGGRPLLAIIRCDAPKSKKHPGIKRGGYNRPIKLFALSATHKSTPRAFMKLGLFKVTDLELIEETPDRLIFRLPNELERLGDLRSDRLKKPGPDIEPALTRTIAAMQARTKPDPRPDPAPALKLVPPEPAPVVIAPVPDQPPMHLHPDQPITLQFPKERISLEKAVAVINAHKKRLQHNLKLHVSEGGYLSVTAKLGQH